MLHHVSIGVSDVAKAAEFYDAVLGALGYKRTAQYLPYAIGYGEGTSEFWIQLPHDKEAAAAGNGAHFGFSARNSEAVHRFHEVALANGGTDNGAPGPRPDYGPDYYGAFVIDPFGNKIEATLHPGAGKARARRAARAKARRTASAKKAAGKNAAGKKTAGKKAGGNKKARAKRAARKAARKAKRQ
jgi:catechol 2,3-dioxygenase-like lactoylglutathione lyase family enzyme